MRLDWPGCVNARDLGDLPTMDGSRIRPGALIRSDNHDRLTDEGLEAVRRSYPSRILDVRSVWEVTKYPSPFASDAVYRNTPVSSADDPDFASAIDDYLWIVDANRDMVAAAITEVATAPTGPVVVHCNAGSDRSGIVTALILAESCVSSETIVADYTLSGNADPHVMIDLLDHVHRAYGGAHRYLRSAGVTDAQLGALRNRLREAH